MVWYDLLQPLRPKLNGQDPFQICEAYVKLEKADFTKVLLQKNNHCINKNMCYVKIIL
jgi:hypothetical protein